MPVVFASTGSRASWASRGLLPLLATALLAGCSTAASSAAQPVSGTAVSALASLPVKGKAAKTGYARERFGQPYADTNHDGCDSRNDALRRDLTGVVIKARTRGCVVQSGMLRDPYGGKDIRYSRGDRSPMDLEHVVALGNAWVTGAQQLSAEQRESLANDPLNVVMVGSAANRGKGDRDASGWLPPHKPYRCHYVARQIAVKVRYSLSVTEAERDAMARVLVSCPAQALPTEREVAFPAPR